LKWFKSKLIFRYIPGPLLAVASGILINLFFINAAPTLALYGDHLVALPVVESPSLLFASLPFPNFKAFANLNMIFTALTIAIVASLESLLSIEAVDKIDPEKRITPTNHELKAQGVGNIVSSLLGGLPITSVIVRSSANVNAGAKSKYSTVFHGLLLLLSLLFFQKILNEIPLASLAAVLLMTGYKLAKPAIFIDMKKKGWDQFIPFVVTIVAILQTDLLKGIVVGIITGFIFVIRSNFKNSVFIMKDEYRYLIRFRKEVSFLNKGLLKRALTEIPDNTAVLIDATKSVFIDRDIIEIVDDFIINAEFRGVRVYIKKNAGETKSFFNDSSTRMMQ
jgi:MFS superfamily sulfate permease-like transporter